MVEDTFLKDSQVGFVRETKDREIAKAQKATSRTALGVYIVFSFPCMDCTARLLGSWLVDGFSQ